MNNDINELDLLLFIYYFIPTIDLNEMTSCIYKINKSVKRNSLLN